MKLRLKNNSVRARLSQTDVRRFGATGAVEESVFFGITPGLSLTYRIVADDKAESLSATVEGNLITLTVPGSTAAEWVSTDRVGIEADQSLSGGEMLHILIEKDFACLEPRGTDEDDDTFPNPLGSGPSEAGV